MTFRLAICALLAGSALLSDNALAAAKTKPFVSVSTKPAAAPDTDADVLGQQVTNALPSLIKQVSICQVVHAVTSSPCGVNALVTKIAPKLFPLTIKKFPINATTLEALKKMNADFSIEADALTMKEPYEIDIRIPSITMGSATTTRGDEVTIDGTIELGIQAPGAPVQGGKTTIDFSGKIILSVFPVAAKCGTAEDDGKTAKLYITPVVKTIKVRDFETARPTWTRFALSDASVRSLTNSLLKLAPAVMLGVEKFQGMRRVAESNRFQPGFEVCIGSPIDCKAKTKPAPAPATVHIEAGELGSIDLTQGVAATPIIDDGGSGFVCKAIEAATTPAECRGPLLNSIIQHVLPLSFPLPNEVIRGTTHGKDTTSNVSIELAKAHVDTVTASKGNYVVPIVIDELKVKNANPGNKDTPLSLKAAAEIHLTPTCKDGSIKLALAGTKVTNMEIANGELPRWLQDGFGRAAINAALPTVKVCFEPLKIPYSNKTLDLCSLTDKLFKTKSTGVVGTIFADGVFPISLEPWKLIPPSQRDPASEAFLKDLVISISKPSIVTGKTDTVTVDVTAKKAGSPPTEIKGLKIGLHGAAHCKKGPGYIQLSPAVETISTNAIVPPRWVLQSAVVGLVNDTLARTPLEVCLQGACMREKVAPKTSGPAWLAAPVVATDCAVTK